VQQSATRLALTAGKFGQTVLPQALEQDTDAAVATFGGTQALYGQGAQLQE
jgi:hypothetical protein